MQALQNETGCTLNASSARKMPFEKDKRIHMDEKQFRGDSNNDCHGKPKICRTDSALAATS